MAKRAAYLPADAVPYYSPKGKINGYYIDGVKFPNRQIQQQLGTLKGTGVTVDRRSKVNKERGTPGRRFTGEPPVKVQRTPRGPRQPKVYGPKPPPQPAYRDPKGKFAPRPAERPFAQYYTTVEFEVPEPLWTVLPSQTTYAPATHYLKQQGQNDVFWIRALGTYDRRVVKDSDPKNTRGWLTVSGFAYRDEQIEAHWKFYQFLEVEVVAVVREINRA